MSTRSAGAEHPPLSTTTTTLHHTMAGFMASAVRYLGDARG
jgi:hypothetical protein